MITTKPCRLLKYFLSNHLSLLIAASHRVRLSDDNLSVSFPWFVKSLGTRQNDRFGHLSLLFPQPTIKQNDGIILSQD